MTDRVLFLSQAPGVGGGERAAMSALARAPQVDVTVAAPSPVCTFAEQADLRTVLFELPHASRPTQLPRLFFGARRVNALARDLAADVIYANGTRAVPYAIAARVLGSPPVLFHHHGLLTKGAVRILARAVDRWASAVVVPSRVCAEPFGGTEKVYLVPNGIDLAHFTPAQDRAETRKRWGIPAAATVIATVTRPDPTKGMEPFLDLAERFDNDDIFLLGGGPMFPHEREPYERIRTRTMRPHHGATVLLTGALSDPADVYRAADVFVHLGEAEGFGLTIVEAMACGLPVVVYNWGAARELVQDGWTGLLVGPNDLGAAAEAVRRMLDDPALRKRITDEARAYCEARFGLDRAAADIAGIIHRLASPQ